MRTAVVTAALCVGCFDYESYSSGTRADLAVSIEDLARTDGAGDPCWLPATDLGMGVVSNDWARVGCAR